MTHKRSNAQIVIMISQRCFQIYPARPCASQKWIILIISKGYLEKKSFFCIFLQSTHQIDMKNNVYGGKCLFQTSPKCFSASKCNGGNWILSKSQKNFENFWGAFLGIFLQDFFGGIFLQEFFGKNFFWEDFFGGIFLEKFFVKIFSGGCFWEDYSVRIFWGGFFGRNSFGEITQQKLTRN